MSDAPPYIPNVWPAHPKGKPPSPRMIAWRWHRLHDDSRGDWHHPIGIHPVPDTDAIVQASAGGNEYRVEIREIWPNDRDFDRDLAPITLPRRRWWHRLPVKF